VKWFSPPIPRGLMAKKKVSPPNVSPPPSFVDTPRLFAPKITKGFLRPIFNPQAWPTPDLQPAFELSPSLNILNAPSLSPRLIKI